jgi:hypothetical protein
MIAAPPAESHVARRVFDQIARAIAAIETVPQDRQASGLPGTADWPPARLIAQKCVEGAWMPRLRARAAPASKPRAVPSQASSPLVPMSYPAAQTEVPVFAGSNQALVPPGPRRLQIAG